MPSTNMNADAISLEQKLGFMDVTFNPRSMVHEEGTKKGVLSRIFGRKKDNTAAMAVAHNRNVFNQKNGH